MAITRFKLSRQQFGSLCLIWKNPAVVPESAQFEIATIHFSEDVPGDPLGGEDYSVEPESTEIIIRLKPAVHVDEKAIDLILEGELSLDLGQNEQAALQSMDGQVDLDLTVRTEDGRELLEDIDFDVVTRTCVLVSTPP